MTIQRLLAGLSGFIGIFILILDGKTALFGAAEGIALCVQTIIPALFPFFLFSALLTGAFVGSPIGLLRPIGKSFRIPAGGESLLIASFLGGYPVGAQSVAEACKNGQLSSAVAERMLSFCSNAGPSFLFGIVAFMFRDRRIAWLLWAIHIVTAWINAQLFMEGDEPILQGIHSISISSAMTASVKTMASVCSWVILFRVILSFLDNWIFWLLDNPARVVISGMLELSNGCCSLAEIGDPKLRFVICSGMLALGGLCVTMQTASVAQGLNLRYYYIGKLLHCISSLVFSICLVYEVWAIPVLSILLAGIYGKTKNTGGNPRKAIV